MAGESARELLEDAVIERLGEELGRAAGGYLIRVAPYNGEADGAEGADDFRRALAGSAPAALVTTTSGDFRARSLSKRRYDRVVVLEVYLISTHLRAREHRLRRDVSAGASATADPGIYKMLEDVFNVLAGDDLGLDDVAPLVPRSEEVLLRLPDLTAWRISFQTEMSHVAVDLNLPAGDVETYAVNANLEGEVEAPNPIVEADGDLAP